LPPQQTQPFCSHSVSDGGADVGVGEATGGEVGVGEGIVAIVGVGDG